MTNV